MELNNIDNLLEKYNNGETTLKEEQQLKNYFSKETVAPHLEEYKPLFNHFLVNQKERFAKEVPLTAESIESKNASNYKWLYVAAAAVLMLGVYFNSPKADLGTYSENETQLAYNEVKQSLQLVSNIFNKGAGQVAYLGELEKAGTQLEYLQDMDKPLNRIFKSKN